LKILEKNTVFIVEKIYDLKLKQALWTIFIGKQKTSNKWSLKAKKSAFGNVKCFLVFAFIFFTRHSQTFKFSSALRFFSNAKQASCCKTHCALFLSYSFLISRTLTQTHAERKDVWRAVTRYVVKECLAQMAEC